MLTGRRSRGIERVRVLRWTGWIGVFPLVTTDGFGEIKFPLAAEQGRQRVDCCAGEKVAEELLLAGALHFA